jgi:hypothetical protein
LKCEKFTDDRQQTTDDGRGTPSDGNSSPGHISKCKLNEAKPNTIELKNKIKKYQSFDQYIAKKNNTVQAYDKFWAPIYIILN